MAFIGKAVIKSTRGGEKNISRASRDFYYKNERFGSFVQRIRLYAVAISQRQCDFEVCDFSGIRDNFIENNHLPDAIRLDVHVCM